MFNVSAGALDKALDHVEIRGDTDIFPLPFEYLAIREEWTDLRSYLSSCDLDTWVTRPLRRCLAPKQSLGLRIATQLDPFDTLLITALMYEIGGQIETARLPREDGNVHSYRYSPGKNGQFFDPAWSYESFRQRSLQLAADPGFRYVVATDIADFFPRIYSHPLENALDAVNHDYARVIMKLLRSWNLGVSYGVPVGPTVFRLLADFAINDVDQSLRSESYAFCRYSDDFRLFANTERDAREALAFLANVLFRNHGLTIQESKTEILTTARFQELFAPSEEDEERGHLSRWFELLLSQLGLNSYMALEYDDLDEEQRAAIDALNLWDIVSDAIMGSDEVGHRLLAFTLRRIRQLGLQDSSDLLLANMRQLQSVFREAVGASTAQSGLDEKAKGKLGSDLLALLDSDVVGHLEYHRAWILEPFTRSTEWNNCHHLISLYRRYSDSFTRTAVVLALGQCQQAFWFRGRKHDVSNVEPWERRALLAAGTCMQPDETRFWHQSIQPQLDRLERAVVSYARRHPMRP